MGETIDILMAVYNGERYVQKQVDSILGQTYRNWRLIIQDDGSTDHTIDLLRPYAQAYPERIFVYQREENSGAAYLNFYSMLPLSSSRYVMFCDHDDVWMPDKIECTWQEMKRLEKENKGRPCLVHTDLKVVGEDLSVLAPSMVRRQKLNPYASFRQIMVQNVVTGCTMMVNRSLLDLVEGVPKHSVMHDWWFALIAAAFGRIGYVDRPTILYRQHGDNQVGAKDAGSLAYNMERLKDQKGARQVLYDTCIQAGEFLRTYEKRLSPKQKEWLSLYRDLPKQGKCRRIFLLFRYRFWKKGFLRKLGQMAFI